MVKILIEVLSTFCSSLHQGFNYKSLVFELILMSDPKLDLNAYKKIVTNVCDYFAAVFPLCLQ